MSALAVRDLGVARGGLALLEGVSFEVPPGAALLLRGPNGAGKTTLLRTLAGLQPASRGEVIPGREAMAYGAHADGMKGQLTVAENLAFWAGMFGASGIGQALEALDLGSLADRPAQYLSAGQKRRLGLARMLLTGRPIWLLDEPTVSLDTASVARFADAVRAHLAGGGTAVIATHADLGLDAATLDVTGFRARRQVGAFDNAFTSAEDFW